MADGQARRPMNSATDENVRSEHNPNPNPNNTTPLYICTPIKMNHSSSQLTLNESSGIVHHCMLHQKYVSCSARDRDCRHNSVGKDPECKSALTVELIELTKTIRSGIKKHLNSFSSQQFKIEGAQYNVGRRLVHLSGDVEVNPGPMTMAGSRSSCNYQEPSVSVTSYNVRGLGDEKKLRHLINSCYKKNSVNVDSIFCFQETYVNNAGKIPYLWRGNFFLTNGNGHSCGCLTLLSSHLNIVKSIDFEERGHLLVCQKISDPNISYIIENIYAPCPNTREKLSFFEKVFDVISENSILYECENIVVAGDFNLNFKTEEMRNRQYSAQESNIARVVEDCYKGLGLKDVWQGNSSFTWRRPNTDVFSTIDRVLYSEALLETTSVKANWALSCSDHAAVEVELKLKSVDRRSKMKITRLDPSILKNEELKLNFVTEVEPLLEEANESWNPHMKLEYSKMCIRTVAERLQADRKKREKVEEEEVNDELNLAINALEDNPSDGDKEEIIEYIEELRDRKSLLVEKKGERLAEKLGTKWYNEGEKSTRYFLNLLKRKAPDSFQGLTDSFGKELTSQDEIEKEIVNFYKLLYEDYDKSKLKNVDIDDNFFNLIDAVTDDEDERVSSRISLEELEQTLLTCSDSAPGPDGIPYSFYRALWRQLGGGRWDPSLSTPGTIHWSWVTSAIHIRSRILG